MRLLTAIVLALSLCACGSEDEGDEDDEPFDTFQDCFDDHNKVEAFSVEDAIKICCIDHPIGDEDANVVCGESELECEDFVDLELAEADASLDEIEDACAGYIVDREL
jgi:hypothetical protein